MWIKRARLPEWLCYLYGVWLVEMQCMNATVQSTLPGVVEYPDNACVYYDQCGNEVPHNGWICSECLDWVRTNGDVRSSEQ